MSPRALFDVEISSSMLLIYARCASEFYPHLLLSCAVYVRNMEPNFCHAADGLRNIVMSNNGYLNDDLTLFWKAHAVLALLPDIFYYYAA